MFTIVFYILAGAALLLSFFSDRGRTAQALHKAWRAFAGILPEFLMIIVVTGLILAFLTPTFIANLVGEDSGVLGVLVASLSGAVTLMPGFVAFPMASLILEKGAGILQIGAFVSSLMMVGIVTFPVERKTFGTRVALTRNVLAWVFSLAVAGVLAVVLGVVA
ncbi:MAG: permease [Alkalispirochaeta sp.]